MYRFCCRPNFWFWSPSNGQVYSWALSSFLFHYFLTSISFFVVLEKGAADAKLDVAAEASAVAPAELAEQGKQDTPNKDSSCHPDDDACIKPTCVEEIRENKEAKNLLDKPAAAEAQILLDKPAEAEKIDSKGVVEKQSKPQASPTQI